MQAQDELMGKGLGQDGNVMGLERQSEKEGIGIRNRILSHWVRKLLQNQA